MRRNFQRAALKEIEVNILTLCEASDLTAVQICVLVGSFYLYTGRPNLGFVILGSGIRCAYALGLHREPSWVRLAEEDIEERRLVWWALFIFDRFAAIVYGHPCGIREGEFQVETPSNLDINGEHHPDGTATSEIEGRQEPVTVFSYLSLKIDLYRASSPILTDLYFRKEQQNMGRFIRDLDGRLSRWHRALPPELRLDVISKGPVTAQTSTFMLQALTLQVAYDNILILLHRPLLQKQQGLPDMARSISEHSDPQRGYTSPEFQRISTASIRIQHKKVLRIGV